MRMKNEKMRRPGLRGKLIWGIILLGIFLCGVACIIGYQRFTTVLERQYNAMAYYIADTALSYVDGDRIDEYLSGGVIDDAFLECQAKLDTLVAATDATFIYVARVDPTDYMTLRYVYDSVHPDSGFDRYPLNYTARDIDPQYVDSVRKLMTSGERSAQYFYSNNEESGAHTTAAVAVYNSGGGIVAMLAVEKAMTELDNARKSYVYVVTAVTFLAVMLFIFLYSSYLNKYTIRPILTITAEAKTFAESGAQLSEQVRQIRSRDEIGTLAQAVYKMQVDIKTYIENLTVITAEKERISAELDVARHIQASMLPYIFPPFPDRGEFDIYASMTPAKEVGGDFYDFFLVDDNHLALVIADVSGKGVPAALFMVIAKTLLKNSAQTGYAPGKVLEKVNNQLCENNEAEMFVTVWLGILEISTGRLVCANAGHEYPALRRAGGVFELVKDKHGFVLAGMEDVRYREYELTLNPGDQLYVYTDGVAEATNARNELYGVERMLGALNRCGETDCEALLRGVKEDIDVFVGEAPQFDDITMLSLKMLPQNSPRTKTCHLSPTLDAIGEAASFVERELEAAEVPAKIIAQINIAVDEIFSNIARYSEAGEAVLALTVEQGKVTLRFSDDGKPYDPTGKPDPDTTLSAEERDIGGLGIFMVKKTMDTLEYDYRGGCNILELTKRYESNNQCKGENLP